MAKRSKFRSKLRLVLNNFKGKIPEASKESVEEFLKSFQSNNIPKKILADFNIDKDL